MLRVLLLASVLTVGASLQAIEVVLSADFDSSIFEESPSNSAGAGPYIFAGVTSDRAGNNFDIRRGLIQFDIAGALPANAMIDSAALELTIAKVPDETFVGTSQSIHRVTASWGAPTASGSGTTGPPGRGTSAVASDATWTSNLFGSSTWATPGGDFVGSASATIGVSPVVNSVMTWSSAQTTSDVQLWLDTPGQNYGWILIGNEGFTKNARGYYSSDNTDLAGVENLPRLVINYTVVPEPSALTLSMGLMTLLLCVAQRRL